MYSSGNSYITSAIVQRITGKTCHQLIEEELAPYIGLEKFSWGESPEGICSGGNGVSITVEGMARLGLLYLNQGKWGEKQLLSADWVNLALGKKRSTTKESRRKKIIIFTGRIQEISGVQMECLDRPVRLFRNKIW